MTRIVAIGESMVEMAPAEQAGTFRMGFAGDTMNTAWYLRRLLPASDRVDYLTAVGTDAISDQMLAFLRDAGIGTDHVARRSDRTVGLYTIQLKDGERSFSYWRGQSAAKTLAEDGAALEAALAGADIAYVSGITLAILPAPDRARLLATLARFRETGGHVAFDPNLRPRLWDSPDQMRAAITEAAEVTDIALPSHEDEAEWFADESPEATAHRYATSGAGLVVVKNGPQEIVTLEGGTLTRHPAVEVKTVIDTTAAGDSFNAGFLAGRLRGESLAACVTAGAELAAKVVQARGALIG